jgi:hypothetical protein
MTFSQTPLALKPDIPLAATPSVDDNDAISQWLGASNHPAGAT